MFAPQFFAKMNLSYPPMTINEPARFSFASPPVTAIMPIPGDIPRDCLPHVPCYHPGCANTKQTPTVLSNAIQMATSAHPDFEKMLKQAWQQKTSLTFKVSDLPACMMLLLNVQMTRPTPALVMYVPTTAPNVELLRQTMVHSVSTKYGIWKLYV